MCDPQYYKYSCVTVFPRGAPLWMKMAAACDPRPMCRTHNTNASYAIFVAGGSPCLRSLHRPVIALISANYLPVMVLLWPLLSSCYFALAAREGFFASGWKKGLSRGQVMQNGVILHFFSLLWMKMVAARRHRTHARQHLIAIFVAGNSGKPPPVAGPIPSRRYLL